MNVFTKKKQFFVPGIVESSKRRVNRGLGEPQEETEEPLGELSQS